VKGIPESIQGQTRFMITFPVRRGAVFSGNPPTASVDGLLYRLTADDDLTGADLNLEEIPAVTGGMPSLRDYDGNGQADYEYRTFRISSPHGNNAFILLEVRPDAP
jgi:hypothetical protein